MNIKSHIKLAVSIVNSAQNRFKTTEKLSFIVGNILPDITCTFLKYPHIPSVMYPCVMSAIEQYLADIEEGINPSYLQTGIVTHYLADFFTSAHNEKFGLNRRAHYLYEQILAQKLKDNILKNDPPIFYLHNERDIVRIITRLHREYMNTPPGFDRDVKYIIKVCNYYVHLIALKIQKFNDAPIEIEDVLIKSV